MDIDTQLEIENFEIELELQQNNLRRTLYRIKCIEAEATKQVEAQNTVVERLTSKINELKDRIAGLKQQED